MLSWELCKAVFDHIPGLVIVDDQAKILYINQSDADLLKIKEEDAIGRHVADVIPGTKIHLTVDSREPVIADMSYFNNLPYYSTRYPIYMNDCFVGVVDYDIFDDRASVHNFLKKINLLSSELDYYKKEVRRLQKNKYSIDNIIGESQPIRKLRQDIRIAAQNEFNVLITGETGTGKELAAHAIHSLSDRLGKNMISVNCSALPDELFEAELFGYDEGAFTNARKGGKIGKFELADKGTIFLDEINQLPLSLQPKLLRAVQEKEIDRVGGKFPIQIDTRIICAANEDLWKMVNAGRFRDDLYYRLNVMMIHVPSLRERREDIPTLAAYFINTLRTILGRKVESVSSEVLDRMEAYDWPGNIRQLQNTMERMLVAADPDCRRLELEHYLASVSAEEMTPPTSPHSAGGGSKSLAHAREVSEKETIISALNSSSGNKKRAAEALGISRTLLYQKIHKYSIH